jgi:Tfp pilus assembly protein PilO
VNEEQDSRMERRDIPAGSTNQEGKGRSNVFRTEGLEHFQYSPKVIVTVGLVSFVFTIIVGTLMGYKSALSEIDSGISNNRTLNKTLDKHEFEIQNLKEETKDMKSEQRSIICQINKGKNCK